MITALVGLMGSGKSYEAVSFHIFNALKNGRRVVTNIPLNRERFAGLLGFHVLDLIVILEPKINEDNSVYTPFNQIDDYYSDWTGYDEEGKRVGTLFVIDEIQLYLPSEKTDLARQAMGMATMQRHRGEDWIIITQDIDNIYKPLARLVSYLHYFEENKSLVGFTSRYKHFVYRGNTRSKATRISASPLKKFDKTKFPLYKSHTQVEGEISEVNIEKTRVNLFKYLIFMLLALFLFGYLLYDFKDRIMGPSYTESSTLINDHNEVIENNGVLSSSSEEPGGIVGPVQDISENVAYDFENVTVTKKTIIRTPDNKSNIVHTVSPVEIVEIERDPVKTLQEYKKAPLDSFILQIFGHIEYGKSKMFIYRLYDSSGSFFEMKEVELKKLGYTLIKSSDCIQLLDHPNINNPVYITCHVPTFDDKEKTKEEKKGKKDKSEGGQNVKVKTPIGDL